ncbi:hypothetical protein [Streptomyces sp. NPDC005805]|uniref:hypothetical protein n=1 Tax=Streptomyces sp. NPDC005805 TaxID=3157068 RepID=UPI0033FEA84A
MRTVRAAATLVLPALLLLTACQNSDRTGAEPSQPPVTVPVEPSPSETMSEAEREVYGVFGQNEKNLEEMARQGAEAAANDPFADPKTADLADLTGGSLELGERLAEAAGFRYVVSEDALGQDRAQVPGNWVVCSQTPGPGTYQFEVLVTLQTVLDGETCP